MSYPTQDQVDFVLGCDVQKTDLVYGYTGKVQAMDGSWMSGGLLKQPAWYDQPLPGDYYNWKSDIFFIIKRRQPASNEYGEVCP